MSRKLVAASTQYINNGHAIVTAAPCSYSIWVNLASAPTAGNAMYVVTNQNNTGGNDISIRIYNDSGITRVEVMYYAGGANQLERGIAFTPTIGTWFHVGGVFTSNTSIQAFYNGVGDDGTYTDTSTGTPVPAGLNDTMFGALDFNAGAPNFGLLDGSIAHAGIWNVALTAAEMALLADGLSPLHVRPESLVSAPRLLGNYSPEPDEANTASAGYNVTGATQDTDPFIYYRWKGSTSVQMRPGRSPRLLGRFNTTRGATDSGSAVVDNPVAAALGTLTLSGLIPEVTQGNSLASPIGTLSLSGLTPTVGQGNSLASPLGTLTLSGLAPTVTQGNSITGPLGTLTLSGLTATITQGNSLAGPLGTLTLSGLTATISQPVSVTAPLGNITLSGLAATITQGNTQTAPLGTLTLSGLTPTVAQPVTFTSPLGTLNLTGLAPSITQGSSLTSPMGTMTLNGMAVTITQGNTLTGPLGTLTLSGLAPTVLQGNAVGAPLGTLTLTGLAPTVGQSESIVAPLGTLNLVGLDVTFGQGNAVVSPLGTLKLFGLVPTFSQTGPIEMDAPLGTISITGLDVTIESSGGSDVDGGGPTIVYPYRAKPARAYTHQQPTPTVESTGHTEPEEVDVGALLRELVKIPITASAATVQAPQSSSAVGRLIIVGAINTVQPAQIDTLRAEHDPDLAEFAAMLQLMLAEGGLEELA